MQKAFWGLLSDELAQEPPCYNQVRFHPGSNVMHTFKRYDKVCKYPLYHYIPVSVIAYIKAL